MAVQNPKSTPPQKRTRMQALPEKVLQATEDIVDKEISNIDSVLDNDDELARLRQKRLQELQARSKTRQENLQKGHGSYTELHNSQSADVVKEFFEITKASKNVVIHFYRPSEYADVMHRHLRSLAERHLETRFLHMNVAECEKSERGANFLVERLKIVVLPALVLVQDRQVVTQVRGFDEMRNGEHATTTDVARMMARHGLLELTEDEVHQDETEQFGSRGWNN